MKKWNLRGITLALSLSVAACAAPGTGPGVAASTPTGSGIEAPAQPASREQAWADKTFAAWLKARKITAPSDILADNPANVAATFSHPTSPSPGVLSILAGASSYETTRSAVQAEAVDFLKLVGPLEPTLSEVMVNTSDGEIRISVTRAQAGI